MEITIQQAIKAHQEGRIEEAERLYHSILENQPTNFHVANNLGVLLQGLSRFDEAEASYRKALEIKPDYEEVHNNLGVLLNDLRRFDEAEAYCRKALEIKPDYEEAHYNLGNTLRDLGRFDEAEASYRKVIELKPGYEKAHYNLGVLLNDLRRFDEAEASYRKVIELKPGYVNAHNNLGNILRDLGRFDEAEASYRKVIELKPGYEEAHYNLGILLNDLHRFDEAEASYRKALEIKPDYAKAHNNLGNILRDLSRSDEAEASYRKALEIKPDYIEATENLNLLLKEIDLLAKIFQSEKSIEKNKVKIITSNIRLASDPFILNRDVEQELVASLYKMNFKHLDKTERNDARYGNGKCSFYLFENNSFIIKKVEKDLIDIMSGAVKSDIFIMESFFNIFHAGSGSNHHNHISSFDKKHKLVGHKFSLVYYLSVGDQDCTDPGFLKLYDPNKEILPSEGMIAIFPGSRKHSSAYNGKKDRVMIGVNFYSLI